MADQETRVKRWLLDMMAHPVTEGVVVVLMTAAVWAAAELVCRALEGK